MQLLLCLAQRPGEVISIDDLLSEVWAGVIVTPDSLYQAVTSLRRILGDDPRRPTYISTVPRLGYRMVATVSPWRDGSEIGETSEQAPAQSGGAVISSRSRFRTSGLMAGAVILIAVAGVLTFLLRGKLEGSPPASAIAAYPQESIAVLPFVDLTEGMKEEEFADGMTEELIDKLSKISGLRVPAPTAAFYFKNKQVPVAEIAKSLGVAYILDGSTRKSGGSMRVAARLVRAENGYVIWSETYDHPFTDRVKVQDEIAGEVAQALVTSIHAKPQSR